MLTRMRRPTKGWTDRAARSEARRSTQFDFLSNSMELEFGSRVYVLPLGRLTKRFT
jgi:hypothetical protein